MHKNILVTLGLLIVFFVFYQLISLSIALDESAMYEENISTTIKDKKSEPVLNISNNFEKPTIEHAQIRYFSDSDIKQTNVKKELKLKPRPKLRVFEVLNDFPTLMLSRVNIFLESVKSQEKLEQNNLLITMAFNEYALSIVDDDNLITKEERKVFDAFLYYTLYECRFGKYCLGATINIHYPMSKISKADAFAWLLLSSYIKPNEEKFLVRIKKNFNSMSNSERDLADYKFNNIIYYLKNPHLPFEDFLSDYWARN